MRVTGDINFDSRRRNIKLSQDLYRSFQAKGALLDRTLESFLIAFRDAVGAIHL